MEKLLESALTNERETSKSDFLKIFYSCLEDESFLDDFRAYMKQYMFHSLKQSKLKFLTEPTQVIKCHSISPKIQSMNLLIADYLLRQDFLYTLSVFSSEAPNLKNLTSFSNYINSLAGTNASVQQPKYAPKLMSRDVKDILECLGLSPQCDESLEARQQYMHCDEDEPLLLCLLSTLVSTLQNIDRCPRCKVSHEELKSLTLYQDCDISQQSPHLPEFSPWQNEICQLLHQYCLGPSEVVELVKKMTVIINKELETTVSKIESQLTEKEEHLRKYEEMFSENLEEAERHLLVQKQSLEKELLRKQKELQEVARVLSKKKANISGAVNILQKQKDLLTEKEKEFNSMMTTLNEQLEVRASNLDKREKKMKEGFDKLSRQKETFYEQLLKVCSSKMDSRKEDSRLVNVRSPPKEHVNEIIEPKIINKIKAVEGRDSRGNGQRSNEPMYEHKGEIFSKTNEIHSIEIKSKPHDLNDRRVDRSEENISVNNVNVLDTVEENISRVNSQDLIALLKTIQVQSEAMKGFLEERHKDVSKQNSNTAQHGDKYRPVGDGSQCISALTSAQGKHSTPGKCVRVIRNDSPLSSLGDSCRVNDENTICDRCGSEVILKFHINEKGQKSASCTKSVSSRLNNCLSPIEDRSLERPPEDKELTGRYENHRGRVRSERCDFQLSIDREREETTRLQSQMAELMTRFEKISANQNGQTTREQKLSNNEDFSTGLRYGQHVENRMNPEPLIQKTVNDVSQHTVNTLKYQPNTAPLPGEAIDDPVDLSRQTLARLSSQISALDESFDKYRDKIRKENELCDSEGGDVRRLERLLSKSSRDEKRGITRPSTRSFLHRTGAQPSVTHPYTFDSPPKPPTLRFTNSRTGSLFPHGKHQKVPPYFSNNPSFWQSYLKTYHVPANKNKSWQEHFQDFAGQVDGNGEGNNERTVEHWQKNMREENGMFDSMLDHISDESDTRSTSNSASDEATSKLKRTSKLTNYQSNKKNDLTVQKSVTSNQNRNRFLDQPNRKTKDQINENEHFNGRNNSLDQRTNSNYNRPNNESDRRNDELKRVKTVESDKIQIKEQLTKESRENLIRKEYHEERKRTNELIEKLPNAGDEPQSDIHFSKDSNVEVKLTKEFTSEERKSLRDAKEKDANIVEPPKNSEHDKKNLDIDCTKDNSIVEYDARGSLLFHMQDSDENRKHPSQTKTSYFPQLTENQTGLRLSSDAHRKDNMSTTAVENQDLAELGKSFGEVKSRSSVFPMVSRQEKTGSEISITDQPFSVTLKTLDMEKSLNPLPPQKVSEIAERNFDLKKSPPEALKSPNYSLSRNKTNPAMFEGVLVSDEDSNSELSVHMPSQRSLDEW